MLSAKRRMFIEAYLATWSMSEAARRAGYKHAWEMGHRLFKDPEIAAAIEERIKTAAMGANEALARLAEQARVNIGDFFRLKNGSDSEYELDMEAVKARGHLIKSIKSTPYGPVLELHDGQTALITIAKHLHLLTERVDLTSGGKPIRFVVVRDEQ